MTATKSSNTQGFKLLRPSNKGTKLLSVTVIKGIIIVNPTEDPFPDCDLDKRLFHPGRNQENLP